MALALGPAAKVGSRRLAYASVAVPTLYVFLGVVQALIRSRVPDEIPWTAMWIGLAIASRLAPSPVANAAPSVGRWRVIHGLTAAVLVLYVLFHLANHLFGLAGPDAHAAVMRIGRTVYRSRVGEPVLVAAMLFQIGTGLYLAWRWSAAHQPFHRTFQVASGAYLSLFILGHMNSVFIYARRFLGIPTDWNFAIGAPTGLLHDPWNIRLLPHYALGVFFVLSHIASGLRVVLISHGLSRRRADRLWAVATALSAIVATAIIAAMCGVRVHALVSSQ
jgi:succinate dehydrogenase hydrophobic anchor subunit